VALYPPMIQWVCPRQFDESLVASVGFAAYASHMTFNSGYVARVGSADFLYCEQLASQIARGELDPATVYVVANEERAELAKHGATCGSADGLVVCVTGQSTPLSEYLRAHP
jgi:hypothetical protein